MREIWLSGANWMARRGIILKYVSQKHLTLDASQGNGSMKNILYISEHRRWLSKFGTFQIFFLGFLRLFFASFTCFCFSGFTLSPFGKIPSSSLSAQDRKVSALFPCFRMQSITMNNPVGTLQERFQTRGEALPIYTEVLNTGPSHCPLFRIQARHNDNL